MFLTQKVIDTKDLLLGKGLVQEGVQVASRGQVRAERFFHDDAGSFDQIGLAEHGDHGSGRVGRHAQIVQAPGCAAQLLLCVAHGIGQCNGSAALLHVVQANIETVPHIAGHTGQPTKLGAGLLGGGAERHIVEVIEGAGDDPTPSALLLGRARVDRDKRVAEFGRPQREIVGDTR